MTQFNIAISEMKKTGLWYNAVEIGEIIEALYPGPSSKVQRGQRIGRILFNRGLVLRRVSVGGRFGKYQYCAIAQKEGEK